jgi:hypothetical protein
MRNSNELSLFFRPRGTAKRRPEMQVAFRMKERIGGGGGGMQSRLLVGRCVDENVLYHNCYGNVVP